MSIIINTNIPAMIARNAMDRTTNMMNRCMARLSTGIRINSAKDDPAGSFYAMKLNTHLRGIQVAYQNVCEGSNVIATAESDLTFINDHLERIKELAAQCANSTVSDQQRAAIKREVQSRVDEINRIATEAEFNDLKLLDGTYGDPKLQIGGGSDPATNSLTVTGVFGCMKTDETGLGLFTSSTFANVDAAFADADTASDFVDHVDNIIKGVGDRISNAGIYQSRLESIANLLLAENENVSSAYSTVVDADIATETADYVKYQILQQTASAVLSQANQAAGVIALKLVSAL